MNRVQQRGLTMIEMMIAMLIGLVVLGGVLTVLLSNSNTYKSNEAVGRIQESTRFAFELMARDLREAGGLPCGPDLDVANVLNNSAETPGANDWWADFNNGIEGFDGDEAFAAAGIGTGAGERVDGTDSVILSGARGTHLSVTEHNATSAQFKVSHTAHGIEINEILVVCDFEQASIFQVTNANQNNQTIVHNTGNVSSGPGNCSKGLGYSNPMLCSANGTSYEYGANSVLARFRSIAWYVGCNGRADCALPEGRSLFKSENGVTGEVVNLVTDLQLQYLEDGAAAYVDSSAVADWSEVVAVQVILTLGRSLNLNNPAADPPIMRTVTHTVALRNRLP